MEANASKLINVSPAARQVMDAWYAQRVQAVDAHAAEVRANAERLLAPARASAEAAARTAAAVREEEDFARWIARIEAGRGPSGRRASRDAALAVLARPDLRQRLVLEASRIEVQAALDKADTLKTRAAKLRTLRAALDAVRGDEVPDYLQAPQIQWLEEAIAELERNDKA